MTRLRGLLFLLFFFTLAVAVHAAGLESLAATPPESGAVATAAKDASGLREILYTLVTGVVGFLLDHVRKILKSQAAAYKIELSERMEQAVDKVCVRVAMEVNQWADSKIKASKNTLLVSAEEKLARFKARLKAFPIVKDLPDDQLEALSHRAVAFLKERTGKLLSAQFTTLTTGEAPKPVNG